LIGALTGNIVLSDGMTKGRLEAFSDGVIAIIITIMVLELKKPNGTDWSALAPLVPVLSGYLLSFIYIGIYWNNHHHLLHAAERVDGKTMWANLHLLFWLSLVPWATAWAGNPPFQSVPTALYAILFLFAAMAYQILQAVIISNLSPSSQAKMRAAIGRDIKGKVSGVLYLVSIPLALFDFAWLSTALFVVVALMWLIPDRRIARTVDHAAPPH
jgi:uncharacterized membrane protein